MATDIFDMIKAQNASRDKSASEDRFLTENARVRRLKMMQHDADQATAPQRSYDQRVALGEADLDIAKKADEEGFDTSGNGKIVNRRYGVGVGNMSKDEFLDLVKQHESGGQNIEQQVVPPGGGYNPSVGRHTGPSSASGLYQMIDPTWRTAAKLAGVDTSKYPRAIDAPPEVQRAAAGALFDKNGGADWLPYNAGLRAAVSSRSGGSNRTARATKAPTPPQMGKDEKGEYEAVYVNEGQIGRLTQNNPELAKNYEIWADGPVNARGQLPYKRRKPQAITPDGKPPGAVVAKAAETNEKKPFDPMTGE